MRTISKHSGRIEVRGGLKEIQAIRNTWRAAYQSALRHDGMPEDTNFAVFSADNPFVPYAEKAYSELCRMIEEYRAGGYVGLRIG